MFLCFILPSAVFIKMYESAKFPQTGVTWGDPSAMVVAKKTRFFPFSSLSTLESILN